MEPALEDAVGELAGVAAAAGPFPKVGTRIRCTTTQFCDIRFKRHILKIKVRFEMSNVTRVAELPRVPPPRLLARVGQRALGPVVRKGLAAI